MRLPRDKSLMSTRQTLFLLNQLQRDILLYQYTQFLQQHICKHKYSILFLTDGIDSNNGVAIAAKCQRGMERYGGRVG
jgi:hypothetical protein